MPDRSARRDFFLDFLGVAADSPLRARAGVYSSHDFGPAGEQVRVILLDTRYDRSAPVLPLVGHLGSGTLFSAPFALLAAGLRVISAWSGLIYLNDQKRHVLSEDQWSWLEAQLAGSPAQVHLLVSSIQVLTANPSMESWGHFPS